MLRNWAMVDALRDVAGQMGETPAKVALAWVLGQPGVGSTLIGASRPDQLTANIAALAVTLPAEHRATLDRISAPEPRMLYSLFTATLREHAVFGASVTG